MNNIKQAPFLGLTGMGGGGTGLALGGAVAKKTYIDDVFSTYVYTGNESARSINNGVDLSGRGGLVWVKSRNDTQQHHLVDTERGSNKIIHSDSHIAESTIANRITGFNDNGFNLGSAGQVNGTSSYDYAGWSLAKAKGFFDIVTWTGNATNSSSPPRDIAHNLGCVPGAIWVKCLTANQSWACYHKSLGATRYMHLSDSGAGGTSVAWWNNTEPTSTHFTVGYDGQVNENNQEYVAYVFAGGESTAATARSINFNGSSDYLSVPTSPDYDFGTGDFTIECWIKADTFGNINGFISKHYGASSSWQFYTDGSGDTSTLKFAYQRSDGGGSATFTGGTVERGQWTHVAVARNGSKLKLFVNGLMSEHDMVSELRDPSSPVDVLIGTEYTGSGHSNQYYFDGQISNVRIVKGTAVYTSSFRPSYEPLTSITNTKLLCCQSSTITAATTIATGSITAGDAPNALADSPFDDPNGFKFGEGGDQNLIKTGSYVGASGANTVNLGWEPQWVIVKNTGSSEPWVMMDSIRGWVNATSGPISLKASSTSNESAYNYWGPTATGWELDLNNREIDMNDQNYIYIAIRMSDGYVAKPEDAGTDSWTSSNYDSTAPAFNANFPVDFALFKRNAVYDWRASGRLFAKTYLKTNNTSAESNEGDYVFDYNDGWNEQTGYNNTEQSWMWKRGPGFDVVKKLKSVNRHNLGQPPEMVWTKRMDNGSAEWYSWHKDLGGGGSNAVGYHVKLNENHGESNSNVQLCPIGDALPTATHFRTGTDSDVRSNSSIAFLFASVTGISKCGTYSGSSSAFTLNLGFQPRIIIIKGRGSSKNWIMFDTTSGWAKTEMGGAETTNYWSINDNGGTTVPAVVSGNNIVCYPVSTGVYFTGLQNSLYGHVNLVGQDYVYYAHA